MSDVVDREISQGPGTRKRGPDPPCTLRYSRCKVMWTGCEADRRKRIGETQVRYGAVLPQEVGKSFDLVRSFLGTGFQFLDGRGENANAGEFRKWLESRYHSERVHEDEGV